MATFGFFADSGLTVPLATLPVSVSTAGGATEGFVFFGSPSSGVTLTREGGTDLTVEVVDADAGSGIPASAVKLALSAPGLDSATGGAALVLGASRAGGVANALAIFWRVTLGVGSPATYTDLALQVPAVLEA